LSQLSAMSNMSQTMPLCSMPSTSSIMQSFEIKRPIPMMPIMSQGNGCLSDEGTQQLQSVVDPIEQDLCPIERTEENRLTYQADGRYLSMPKTEQDDELCPRGCDEEFRHRTNRKRNGQARMTH
ncbi:hypothetical protein PFISCL1PPCAC_1020, partial [Pristionchus fissidentatus]